MRNLTNDEKEANTKVLAVDIGLKSIGAYCNDGTTYSWNAPKYSEKLEYIKRMDLVNQYYIGLFNTVRPEILVLEQPVGFRSADALKAHWVGFSIAYSVGTLFNCDLVCPNINTIKSWAVKYFNQPKVNYKRLTQEVGLSHGVISENTPNHEHIADAYMVYLYYINQK